MPAKLGDAPRRAGSLPPHPPSLERPTQHPSTHLSLSSRCKPEDPIRGALTSRQLDRGLKMHAECIYSSTTPVPPCSIRPFARPSRPPPPCSKPTGST